MLLRDVGPYYAPFFTNVLSYWNQRSKSNILIVHYEDMKKDLASIIKKIAEFLDVELSDENLGKLVEHTSFKSMRANPMCNSEIVATVSSILNKNE